MSSWPSTPPPDGKIPGIRIVRTPATARLNVTCYSRTIVGAMTHYAGGRTQLCTAPNCPECDLHHAPRWYGYLAVYGRQSLARRIFEFPQGPFGEFRDYTSRWKDLLGVQITAYRQPARPNGPVQIDLAPPDENVNRYPDEPDVFRILCQIWKLHHVDQLRDYNAANLNDADGVNVPSTPTPPVDTKPRTIKDRIEPYTRGLDLSHLRPATRGNGSN
ncbi:hypothetical protein LCGC14_1389670 [marine sediment metagenome]|uniref:Uncharacterized protein n=1 Tax=marine sediment metagenome TaxID=412755 RepID=A0A0F9N1W9_9ZZZZ